MMLDEKGFPYEVWRRRTRHMRHYEWKNPDWPSDDGRDKSFWKMRYEMGFDPQEPGPCEVFLQVPRRRRLHWAHRLWLRCRLVWLYAKLICLRIRYWNRKKIVMTIKEHYDAACKQVSDINEHLPTLKRYAEKCDHVTEFGVRGVVSTWALLAGGPKIMDCYDIEKCDIDAAMLAGGDDDIQMAFHQKDVLLVTIAETDLLFIDTLHTYRQLRMELALHSTKVKKFIILHDTVTFGHRDEFGDARTASSPRRGLRPAIEHFLASDAGSCWSIAEVLDNNNGLTVLARDSKAKHLEKQLLI